MVLLTFPSVVINTATAIRYYAFKEDMTNPRMHTRNEQKAALL